MPVEFLIVIFTLIVGIYVYFRLSGRLHTEPIEKSHGETSSEKLFHSKAQDVAFFDGESEQYAEALARLRQYGGA